MDLKRKIVVTAVAGVAVVGAGGAIAADKLRSPKEESQAVLNDAAQQLGVQPSELSAALKKALSNRVDEAVEDGRLTKAEGDALKARINAGEFPLFGVPHGPGFGFKDFGRGPLGLPGPDHFLSTAADYLGLTQAQLRTQLNSGKTLAQIARDRSKSVEGLVDKLVADKSARIDQAVEDGRLTRAEANEIKADLKEQVTDFVNNGRLELRDGGPGFGFKDFGPGPDVFPGPDHLLSTAADYLGLTQAQLRTQLNSGKTLAQVANDRNKSVEGLVDKLVASKKARIEEAVKDGQLTRAQADEIEADLKQQVTDFVNNGQLEFHFRKFRGDGPGFRDFRGGSGSGELPGLPDDDALELGPAA
jgi:polyhydroxyalkanoate synthesis regulator phasin